MAVLFSHVQSLSTSLLRFFPSCEIIFSVPIFTCPIKLHLRLHNGRHYRGKSAIVSVIMFGWKILHSLIHILEHLIQSFLCCSPLDALKRSFITRIENRCDDRYSAPLFEKQEIIVASQAICLSQESLSSVAGTTCAKVFRNKIIVFDEVIATSDTSVIVFPVALHRHLSRVPRSEIDVERALRIT